jgi:hypothetical protein
MCDDAAPPTEEQKRAQEMKNRVERLTLASWPHVVSILILDKTRDLSDPSQCIVDQGSGILLRSDERRFILTARHVVEGYRGHETRIAALGAPNGQQPFDITAWTIIDESEVLDIATIDVPRGFEERKIDKQALRITFPLVRVEKGEPCVFFGFPGMHRRAEPGRVKIGLSPISDYVVAVNDRGFIVADELGERETVEFEKGLNPFGPTGGVSGSGVLVRRDEQLVLGGVVYEGGEGHDAIFFASHADFLLQDGRIDYGRVPR